MPENYNIEKHRQLGMNASTASARLVKDTLYRLIVCSGNNKCYRCGGEMTRETFSIEHKTPWLHSDVPVELFFDQDNIAFSHLACNVKASRKPQPRSFCGSIASYNRGCRCESCKEAVNAKQRRRYTTEKRRERKTKTGH